MDNAYPADWIHHQSVCSSSCVSCPAAAPPFRRGTQAATKVLREAERAQDGLNENGNRMSMDDLVSKPWPEKNEP